MRNQTIKQFDSLHKTNKTLLKLKQDIWTNMSEDPSTLSAIKCVIVGDGAVGKFGSLCYVFSIYIKTLQL